MERILIIGGCGAGKTTLARQLAAKLQLPLVHLDRLYWRDNWECVSTEEFDRLLMQELIKPRWILDGNFTRTLPLRLRYCDTVIYLDFSRMQCVCGVIQRILKYYGKSRPDMGGDCPERFDQEKWIFLKAVWSFNKQNRKRYADWLRESGVTVIRLKSRRQAARFLRDL